MKLLSSLSNLDPTSVATRPELQAFINEACEVLHLEVVRGKNSRTAVVQQEPADLDKST